MIEGQDAVPRQRRHLGGEAGDAAGIVLPRPWAWASAAIPIAGSWPAATVTLSLTGSGFAGYGMNSPPLTSRPAPVITRA